MTERPKNPSVEQVADVPFDKDGVSPLPQFAVRTRTAGAADTTEAPLPADDGRQPDAQEEYPGPQTASSGEHVEPGRKPTTGEPDR